MSRPPLFYVQNKMNWLIVGLACTLLISRSQTQNREQEINLSSATDTLAALYSPANCSR